MSALSIRAPSAQRLAVITAAGALAFFTLAAVRFGTAALALPLAGVLARALIQRARLAVALLIAAMVLVEGSSDDFLGFRGLYDPFRFGVTPAEGLLGLAVLAVLLDRMRAGRALRLAGPLTLPLALVVLATAAGAVTGAFHGVSGTDMMFAARQLACLVIVPLLVVNVVETPRQLRGALAFAAGLATIKAAIGVAGVVAGVGIVVEGATISYYESTANWLTLLGILIVGAALFMHARPPAWVVAATPLLILSLALSFRRSFWIAAVLGILLVFLLASRPLGRRIAVTVAILLGLAAWSVSLQPVQTETPIIERATSLQPSKVESNAQDRYRIDELHNVTAEIRAHPITGLGLGGQWAAIHPLAIEHENGRSYTHVVALWWWMKLGILGVIAYLAVIGTMIGMGWQVWRRSSDRLFAAAGLGIFCGVLSLAIVETVGSFTGIDPRFTALVGGVAGLLAVLRRLALRPAA
jgi:O-antigen ligase